MSRGFIFSVLLPALLLAAPVLAADKSSGDSKTARGGMVCRTAEGDHGLPLTCGDNASKQTANIPATTIATTSPVAGTFYKITCVVVVTRAGSASSTMPACNYRFTDETGTTQGAIPITAAISGANKIGVSSSGSATFFARANTSVDYSTVGYAGSGPAPMNYSVHVLLQQLW